MTVTLLRHGATEGNLRRVYLGSTDEPLCEAGRQALTGRQMPAVQMVFVSPMRRCIETARLLWPDVPQQVVPGLRECSFGAFEGKSYEQLCGNADYLRWLESGGMVPPPGGEGRKAFSQRCCGAFEALFAGNQLPEGDYAVVTHGGVLMALLERYGEPRRDFYSWQTANGCGWRARVYRETTLRLEIEREEPER